MKITKTQLKQIIKEEIEAILDGDNITEDWEGIKKSMGKGLRKIPGLKGDTGARLAADLGLDPEEQARRAARGDYLSKGDRALKQKNQRAEKIYVEVGAIGKQPGGAKFHQKTVLLKYIKELQGLPSEAEGGSWKRDHALKSATDMVDRMG